MSGSRHTILNDGFDREVFAQALAREPALQGAIERLGRLLPSAEPLVADLYFALFKLNVVVLPADEVTPSSLVNRRLAQAVADSQKLAQLRRRTQLDESEATAAAVVLADHVRRALTRDYRVVEQELIELADAAHDEDALEELEGELDHLEELDEQSDGQEEPFGGEEQREKLRQGLEREAKAMRQQLKKARKRQGELAESLTREINTELNWKIGQLDQQLDEMDEQLENLGLSQAGQSGDGKVSAQKRLELGRHLLGSRKLQLLAKLVGAFREVAFEARRQRVSRAPQELHQVQTGAELARLLPSELLGLPAHRGKLHLDFLRRLVEGQLLQYQLEGAAERGPMVICVDGSGSMTGSKELWAKAVALTLMEIARREKRRCLAITFSTGTPLLEVELLGRARSRGGRAQVREQEVLRFAEHFPGGGTSFEEPLGRALDAVASGTYRRGDIVFITDGEAHVSDALVERVDQARKRHRFRIRGVEVDVRPDQSRRDTLERFCDDVRTVTDLTADSIADVFAAV